MLIDCIFSHRVSARTIFIKILPEDDLNTLNPMNKFILILAFSGSWLLAAGQSNFVKIYYPKINDAELAITREDFRQAAALYKEAFSSVKSPFAKDLFNAFVCKVLLND